MANIDITFVNPANNAEIDVELDGNMNTPQVIQALVENNFIQPLEGTLIYTLLIKEREDGGTIPEGQTLAQAGVRANDRIAVVAGQRGG